MMAMKMKSIIGSVPGCVRSRPHHDAIPGERLIKRWLVGVKKVLRNDLPKKNFANGRAKASYFSIAYGSYSIFGRKGAIP
jgi:hypothetical protein